MSLRVRIALSLLAIAAILVVPAAYGIGALRELGLIASRLQTRDAVGALALGRVQAGLGEAESQQRAYLALATFPEDRAAVRVRVDSAVAQVDAGLLSLTKAGYASPAAEADRRWQELRQAIALQQSWVRSGQVDRAGAYLQTRVSPGFAAMNAALDPVGVALNRGGEAQVRRARDLADRSATTVLVALAVALALSLLVAGWLARSLLGPLDELRRGMYRVAEGELEPVVRIPPDRPDELGDLHRSFLSMTEQLAELDRLKAEFVSVASHELKTPLSVIRGYSALLRDGIYGSLSEAQGKVIAAIADQTDRLTRLVQRLLDVSRFEAGGGRLELRSIPIRNFFGELADDFKVLAVQSRIRFGVEVDAAVPPSFTADPDRLNEVLGNLLSNAFKFTPEGGRICLRVAREGAMLRAEVEDTGIGIPPDKLPKVFEKFFQVENEAQPRSVGSGLGLAISREIVEAHGGTIGAESRVGEGTVFHVLIPLQPPVASPGGPPPHRRTR